jgi:hypothetical protein
MQHNHIITQSLTQEDGHELQLLGNEISKRQQDHTFMRFLREQSMNGNQNTDILLEKLQHPQHRLFGVKIKGVQERIGYVLFHCFNAERKELEISCRVSPTMQRHGICTASK